MNRYIKISLLVLILTLLFPAPKAQAIDPVTLAILAPIALKVADAARPYLVRSALNTVRCMGKMGKDMFEIFYLPYGFLKMTVGAGSPRGWFIRSRGRSRPGNSYSTPCCCRS